MNIKITINTGKMRKYMVILLLFFYWVSAFSQAGDDNLKVLTYNIWNGYDWGKDEGRRAEVAGWIKIQDADIVALQELCKYTPEKLGEDARVWGHPHSALLKTTGYSVGGREKIRDGMHHGALHCVIQGIDVFVIHFHPGEITIRRKEAGIILDKLAPVRDQNQSYLVLVDFNRHSLFDADLHDPEGSLLTRMKERYPDKGTEAGNLTYGDLDYSMMSSLLAFPLMDVCRPFTTGLGERGSFPGRILGPINKETEEQLVLRLERIDYILASPYLSARCTGARVCNGKENHFLSDHYPVVAEFDLSVK
jgi:endonuclease/exonuclease/phosphatase family metal-dependent hydrolase